MALPTRDELVATMRERRFVYHARSPYSLNLVALPGALACLYSDDTGIPKIETWPATHRVAPGQYVHALVRGRTAAGPGCLVGTLVVLVKKRPEVTTGQRIGPDTGDAVRLKDPADLARLMRLAALQESRGGGDAYTLTAMEWPPA